MTEPAPVFAAIVQPPGVFVDEMLAAFAEELKAEGVRVRGLVQDNQAVGDGCACTMELIDVDSGRRFRISQELGAGSTSCRIDPAGVAAAAVTLQAAVAERAELVLANRFGALEKAGGGLAHEMLAAMASGTPFITVVARAYLDDWQAFTGGLGDLLPADPAAWRRWLASVRAGRAA